ncbi:MAG: NUDIX hydrolase [Bacteroidales bacterium]|nr:NUDIX hydrolase [Bacteroidales bacterium]
MRKRNIMPYTYQYPRASVTVDIVMMCSFENQTKVLLIQRGNEPFKNKWAFPGGFIELEETLEESAKRELEEETGLTGIELMQFRTYGDPGRDPRGRTVSVVFYGFTDPKNSTVAGADDAINADWFKLNDIREMAFDHQIILEDLLRFLKLEKT